MSYIVTADGCWIWQGGINNKGYGYWGPQLAHRRIYEQHVGPIPAGLELDHLCRNTRCVNPEHLEPVTHAENCRRGRCGEVNAARQLARTHCKNGHEYTPDNTSTAPAGHRRCKECARRIARNLYRRSYIPKQRTAPPWNKGQRMPHGTMGRYGRGCRCDECRQANTEYKRQFRLRKAG